MDKILLFNNRCLMSFLNKKDISFNISFKKDQINYISIHYLKKRGVIK